ncbi:MAG: putative motility protein [Clostridiaceae bacterium]|nr:putative motility protein [Clostridiaceae bacterium]
MDLMNSIASSAMSMSAASFAQSYDIAVTKKMMDTEELALQELTEMLPPSPYNFDVYA